MEDKVIEAEVIGLDVEWKAEQVIRVSMKMGH